MTGAALGLILAVQASGGWQSAPPLPRPVTNNAVATVETESGASVFSFLGLDATRSRSGEVSWAFRWDLGDPAWREVAPVPGPGRLAATAQAVKGRVYVFGGYTVAEDGAERSVPWVDVYDPSSDSWGSRAPIPVPVDDAVSGVWRDSLVYLVSGWHDDGNETLVQIYDPATDRWDQGTPIPGPPVFGHAGGLARDALVYVDGVRVRAPEETPEGESRFELQGSAWRGDIDPSEPTRITWTRLPDHPGPPLYRAAAGVVGTRIVFVGGSDNAYNYDGIGYDGRPSAPARAAFSYDLVTGSWSRLSAPSIPTMDHRGLVRAGGYVVLLGGMEDGQRVTDGVRRITLLELLTGGR
jgi:N-acetylneuraminic acid mutarotase